MTFKGLATNSIAESAEYLHGLGGTIMAVVLCATLVYELFGPLLTKWSLQKAGEIPNELGIYPYEEEKKKS